MLDYQSKDDLVKIDCHLNAKMKPHQTEGVRFMFNATFESIEQIHESNGGGCILAHCMGLGE